MTGGPFPVHSSVVVKRSCFDMIGGYNSNLRLAEDWDLFFRLSKCCEFASVPRAMTTYCIHSDNISSSCAFGYSILHYRDASFVIHSLALNSSSLDVLRKVLSFLSSLYKIHPFAVRSRRHKSLKASLALGFVYGIVKTLPGSFIAVLCLLSGFSLHNYHVLRAARKYLV